VRLRFSIKYLVLASLLAVALPALSGCQFFGGSKTQTLSDPAGAFHYDVPASWTATITPGLITMYGDEEMPSLDSAIGDTPWYFVLSAKQEESTALDKQVVELAENRSKSRGWKDVTMGKPHSTKLGGAPASEIDLSATDDLGRPFEGKLLVSRVENDAVLVFAFTRPGSFEKHGKFEDLKKNFYWFNPLPEKVTSQTAPPKLQDPELKDSMTRPTGK
jgi:hypothetical protein